MLLCSLQSPKKVLNLSTYQAVLFLIDLEQATEPKRTAFTIAEIILCQSSLSLEEKAVGSASLQRSIVFSILITLKMDMK